jgi:hypothetical protein
VTRMSRVKLGTGLVTAPAIGRNTVIRDEFMGHGAFL